ncbi:hypothetical protein B9Z55_017959 [Caenorhabditis nigoni]|uniref:Uncharacterized protein n=1 Tax=Caenorhabditis nigoni TaxID=1611254 RepID=A0A2G5TBY7_9PELO|nr:hypothetical protein B9Z55_017959 [Caenorhabditis nigoni]
MINSGIFRRHESTGCSRREEEDTWNMQISEESQNSDSTIKCVQKSSTQRLLLQSMSSYRTPNFRKFEKLRILCFGTGPESILWF